MANGNPLPTNLKESIIKDDRLVFIVPNDTSGCFL